VSFGPDGKAVRLLGTGVDITARKQTEAAREELLEALSAQPALNVCVLRGPRFVFEMANAVYVEQVAGGRELVGKPLFEALPELKGQGFEAHFTRLVETGEPFVGREVPTSFHRRGDGTLEEGFYNFVHQPVRSKDGTFESILCIGQDVTHMVRAREQMERLIQQEKERAGFEQQLIGIVSHDLRNPLSAILLGAAALARREELDERSLKAVLRIQSSAERGVRMVKDLLDFTQARLGGGIPVHRRPFDMHTFTLQVVEEVQASFPERDIGVRAEGSGQGIWDADRLAQVVTNLVSNALKYSPGGTPVTVRTRGEEGQLVLEVHNLGAPVPPEALGRLFQPMQRASSQGDSSGRSVGLGLYIVKHVVDAHRGTITVKSTEAEGTTFTVRLPRASDA
jgi:signal transduction histidine kinase